MIEFEDVEKAFGPKAVLRGLSFAARDGAVTGFVGPNGAGKSTAFKILLGLLDPDRGGARVDGVPYPAHPDPGRAVGAYLGPQWIPGAMTGRAFLAYTADLIGAPRTAADRYLTAVGLDAAADRRVRTYSLGMRQRLGLAASFIGEPANLVLDEPVNGLDVEGVRWLREYLRAVAGSGRCVLLSSHLMSELELVADDVVMLAGGRASHADTVENVRTSGSSDVVVVSEDDAAVAAHLRGAGAQVEQQGRELVVRDRTVNWVVGALASQGVPLVSVARRAARLEDVYLAQVQQHDDEAVRS